MTRTLTFPWSRAITQGLCPAPAVALVAIHEAKRLMPQLGSWIKGRNASS